MSALPDQMITLIIPVHNRKPLTLACLEHLRRNGNLEQFQVLVVDDGSTDGTGEAICSDYPEVEVLKGDGDLWWTGAIAQGMKYACEQGAEYLIWLNDDCQPAPETIPALVQFCREHPGAIAGAQGVEGDQPEQVAFGGKVKTWKGFRFLQVPPGQVQECDLLSGNLVCLPRAVVEAIGYPDPHITPHYGGDSLFLIRAKKAGFRLFVDARYPVLNSPGEPKLYPTRWLTAEGEPLRILKMVFVPQSGLSWRVWWQLNWEAYSVWGIFMFVKKFSSILLITLLRYLPLDLRKKMLT